MRYKMLLVCLFFPLSCSDNSTQPSPPYESMLFVRQGGGSKVFNVFPTTGTDTFQITVTQYEFRDTTVHLVVIRDNTNAASFEALTQTLNGQIQLVGDFKQSTLPTGTWTHLYVVKGAERIEITNNGLRNLLSNFENIVKAKMLP